MGLTVGLLYNLGKYDPPEEGEPPDIHAELDGEATIVGIAEALRWGGHEVVFIEGNEDAWDTLRRTRIDIAFNICEGLRGTSRESHIPAMLEMLGIPYTGSNVLTLALALDKAMAKRIFQQANVPTARFAVFSPGEDVSSRGLRFPLFVKPAWEGSSIGVSPASLVRDEEELTRQVTYITSSYHQPALVEEYLEGREFTIGMVGNDELEMLPIREIRFDHCPAEHGPIYSYQYKTQWDREEYFPCPADIPAELAARIRAVAVSAFRALECRDIGRVDVRLDAEGTPNVIEANPLPGLAPGFSDLPQAAVAGGMTYNLLVNKILDAAIERCGLARKAARYAAAVRSAS